MLSLPLTISWQIYLHIPCVFALDNGPNCGNLWTYFAHAQAYQAHDLRYNLIAPCICHILFLLRTFHLLSYIIRLIFTYNAKAVFIKELFKRINKNLKSYSLVRSVRVIISVICSQILHHNNEVVFGRMQYYPQIFFNWIYFYNIIMY